MRIEAEGDPWALADAGQLHQVVLNLAFNARDAMPTGGTLVVRTRIEALTNAKAGHPHTIPIGTWSVLEVEDDGTGMDEAEIIRRVQSDARIAANHGASFGRGGDSFLRFNLATPRARVTEAADRLKLAFADLQ